MAARAPEGIEKGSKLRFGARVLPGTRPRRGFTLIELLVVLSIIALVLSILVPYLRSSREEGKKLKCLANLREISAATLMYTDDQEGRMLLPWYQIPAHQGYSPSVFTPWVFGGFRAPKPEPGDPAQGPPLVADSSLYPAQIRPLNKYIEPSATAAPFNFNDRGRDVIKSFICPGDRSYSTTLIGQSGQWIEEERRGSWEANGSSYSLNTRWFQGYAGFDFTPDLYDPPRYAELSDRLARHLVGGGASRFILWAEQGFYSATYNAAPKENYTGLPPALPQRDGWHRKFSSWSVGFADGHATHGYFDTRYIYGLGGTIWQPGYP